MDSIHGTVRHLSDGSPVNRVENPDKAGKRLGLLTTHPDDLRYALGPHTTHALDDLLVLQTTGLVENNEPPVVQRNETPLREPVLGEPTLGRSTDEASERSRLSNANHSRLIVVSEFGDHPRLPCAGVSEDHH